MNQPQLPLNKSTPVTCTNCDGIFFDQTTLLRKISRLHLGTPTDIAVPVMAFVCRQCGQPNTDPDFLPEGMPDIEERFKTESKPTPSLLLP